MRYSFQDRPVSKFGPPIWNCDKSHFSQLPCIRRHNSVISQPITMKFGTHTGGAAGEVCHLWLPCSSFFTNEQLNFVKYTAPYELHHVLHSLSSMLKLICTWKVRNKYIQYSRRLQLQASSNRPCFTPCNVCSEIFCSIEYSAGRHAPCFSSICQLHVQMFVVRAGW